MRPFLTRYHSDFLEYQHVLMECLYSVWDAPGTPGYFAPETLTRFENSFASDVFQAGVILYALLSGQMPFEDDLTHVLEGAPRPMEGFAWAGRSHASRDLVKRMLAKDPQERISLKGILEHPWLNGGAMEVELGEAYVTRVQHLVLKQKMKKFFVSHSKDHLRRRMSLETAAPCLGRLSSGGREENTPKKRKRKSGFDFINEEFEIDEEPQVGDGTIVPVVAATAVVGGLGEGPGEVLRMDYRSKLRDLKERVLTACAPSRSRYVPPNTSLADKEEKDASYLSGKIDWETFCQLMDSSGLPELAQMAVFQIFDHDGDGAVNIQEFMVRLSSRIALFARVPFTCLQFLTSRM